MDINDLTWNPWYGCHKCSEGCQNCYAYFLDKRYGRDTSIVSLNKLNLNLPIKKDKAGNYKIPSGAFVRVCMTSDFFLEEADEWRKEAWDYIHRRPDVTFSLLQSVSSTTCPQIGATDGITFNLQCRQKINAVSTNVYLIC